MEQLTAPLIFIVISILALLFLSFKYKKAIIQEAIIAALISLSWVILSGIYIYKGQNFIYFDVNIFPFILWTLGLVILREIYEKMKNTDYALIKVTALYWLLLIAIEYFGYGMFAIQLDSNYPGLFNLPFLHAPLFAQVYYLAIGPIYLLITDYLGVK